MLRQGEAQPLARAFMAACPQGGPFVFLETQGRVSGERFSLMAGKPLFLFTARAARARAWQAGRATALDGSPRQVLARLACALRECGLDEPAAGLFPLVGWLGYEAGAGFDRMPRRSPAFGVDVPEWLFFLPGEWITRQAGRWVHRRAVAPPGFFETLARRVPGLMPYSPGSLDIRPAPAPATTPAAYMKQVRAIQRSIRAGDFIQANLSHGISLPAAEDGFGLFRRLSAINPSPFAAYARVPGLEVVSASPERLFSQDGDRVETQPIAGTHPRLRRGRPDPGQVRRLLLSAKERAEHLMLVDLERNDLGRVCRPGSVRVEDFMRVEELSHVYHLVSRVTGRLRPGLEFLDLLAAGFPGGTITGAPKLESMRQIARLEGCGRGLYTGSLGYWDPWHRRADFNILIRTILLAGGKATFRVGAGIVADSDPAREWEETQHKAAALKLALGAA